MRHESEDIPQLSVKILMPESGNRQAFFCTQADSYSNLLRCLWGHSCQFVVCIVAEVASFGASPHILTVLTAAERAFDHLLVAGITSRFAFEPASSTDFVLP